MEKCKTCGSDLKGQNTCQLCGSRQDETNEPGTIGIGFDPSCGTIEPTINLGGGIGLGLDGHLTIGGF